MTDATTSKKIKLDLKCEVCGDDSFGVDIIKFE